MTTWTISSGPSGNLPAGLESRERPRRRGHQEFVTLVNHSLRVLRVDMRMTARDAVLVADASDGGHRLDDGGMVVLARVAEVLREITFADQHDADARHLFQDARQVVDRLGLLAHDDDEDLAARDERPHVRLRVVLLR